MPRSTLTLLFLFGCCRFTSAFIMPCSGLFTDCPCTLFVLMPAKYPEIPGIIPSFFTHSRNPDCYFINPEKSRVALNVFVTHPDLLVMSLESVKLRMCSPEEDVQRACARGADVSLRRACRLKVFFIPFQAFERAMAGTCTGESGRNSTDFFQYEVISDFWTCRDFWTNR